MQLERWSTLQHIPFGKQCWWPKRPLNYIPPQYLIIDPYINQCLPNFPYHRCHEIHHISFDGSLSSYTLKIQRVYCHEQIFTVRFADVKTPLPYLHMLNWMFVYLILTQPFFYLVNFYTNHPFLLYIVSFNKYHYKRWKTFFIVFIIVLFKKTFIRTIN